MEPPVRDDAGSVACWAPRSALYLRPDGVVSACCSTGLDAGTVTGPNRQSLRAIWTGATLAHQARALASGSFDLGCQECGIAAAAGERSSSLAADFDEHASETGHAFPLLIDFALSSRCNLQCVMCNGNLSSSIRIQRERLPALPPAYDDRFFEELDEFLPHLRRARFKGGEPFLASENRRVWDRLIETGLQPDITVTTNGTLFNDEIEHYVRALGMQPILSTDAVDDDELEAIRVGISAPTFWANVERFQQAAAGRFVTLGFCLMATNWRQFGPMLREAEQRGCRVHVSLVNQPSRYDLLRLPAAELAAVRSQLLTTAPSLETSWANDLWERILRTLQPANAVPVQVGIRLQSGETLASAPSSLGTDEVATLRASLEADLGHPGVELELEGDLVLRVEVPAWAGWLDAERWIGLHLDDLPREIEAATGATLVAGAMPTVHRDTTRYVLALDVDGRRQLLRVTMFDAGEERARRVFVHPESFASR